MGYEEFPAGSGVGELKIIDDTTSTSNSTSGSLANINKKALLRKLGLHLLEPLTILYLLSFLDRSNGNFPHLVVHIPAVVC